jgi:hypothetical protein
MLHDRMVAKTRLAALASLLFYILAMRMGGIE